LWRAYRTQLDLFGSDIGVLELAREYLCRCLPRVVDDDIAGQYRPPRTAIATKASIPATAKKFLSM